MGYVVPGGAGTEIRFTRLLGHAPDMDSNCFSLPLRTTGPPENINNNSLSLSQAWTTFCRSHDCKGIP